jgi:hypothetical protein
MHVKITKNDARRRAEERPGRRNEEEAEDFILLKKWGHCTALVKTPKVSPIEKIPESSK